MQVAVFGCGPAGLMAAHGATVALSDAHIDCDLAIFSRKRKSPLYGAQYLHRPIPFATKDDGRTIDYILRGSAADYRRKVYGQMWSGSVSPEDLGEMHRGWDIRQTYDWLWDTYEPYIKDTALDPIAIIEVMDNNDDLEVVINSIPLDSICYMGHNFDFTPIIAAGDAPDLGIDIGSTYRCIDETVICNGDPEVSWYRMSRIFGHTTVEWPGKVAQVPISTASTVRKPTQTNCDCWPTLLRVGRYGQWKKGVLSHSAYFDAYKHVTEKIEQEH